MADMNSKTVERIRAELAGLKKLGREDARAMPGEFYTSEDFLELEKEHLFRKEWICLGHVGEVANPGDFYTTELLGELLLVTRDREGDVHVLSNVCRHRGNQVETGERGNKKRFVCGYHAWTYGLGGELKTAPLMKSVRGFDMKACRLPEIRSEIWQNFIFVNLDGNAGPLGPTLTTIAKIIENYEHENRNLLFHAEDVWNTNWKNLTENFMEGYHLSATHLKTLHPITPTKLCKKVPGEDGFTAYRAYYDPGSPDRTPHPAKLTEAERRNSVLFCVYPSFVISVATNCTLFLCLRPSAPGQVAIRWGVAGFGTDPEAQEVKDYVALCNEFNAEDREKLETLHKALNTRMFRSGPLAPDDFEGTIWDFLLYVAGKLGADVELATAEV